MKFGTKTGQKKYILEDTHWEWVFNRTICEPCAGTDVVCMEDLCRLWLESRKAKIKKSTYCNYKYMMEHYILRDFQIKNLRVLHAKHILDFAKRLQEKNYADGTIYVILSLLKGILNYGVYRNWVNPSIMETCIFNSRKKEKSFPCPSFTVEMRNYLLDRKNIFSIGVLLCRSTGLRIGELCGLKWEDFDFKNGTFRVVRTVSRIANPNPAPNEPKTVLYIRQPKTKSSIREIPIPSGLIDILAERKQEDAMFFLTGTPICTEPRNVQKRFKTLLRRCHMQDCNFHALRHNFASTCLEKGVDCKTVASILGHASIKTTMDIYVHPSLTQKKCCVNSIL